MTFPSVPRSGLGPSESPSGPAEPEGSDRSSIGAPEGAVSLADLVADSGPLPPDAALECVQRLAERLDGKPDGAERRLGPSDVLIDDDGGIWLVGTSGAAPSGSASDTSRAMDRVGRLLAFLVTGDERNLADGVTVDTAALPATVSIVLGRLCSRNGSCFGSYADLASVAAALRGQPAPAAPQSADGLAGTTTHAADETVSATLEPTEPESSGVWLALGLGAAAAVGAAAAYALWQWL